MRRPWLWMALAIYVSFIVTVITLANVGGTEEVFGLVTWIPQADKGGHFVLIGALAMLADLAAGRRDLWLRGRRLPAAPCAVALLVLAEELSQLGLATRTFDLADLAADALGMLCFVSVGRVLAVRLSPCEEGGRPAPRRS